MHITVIVLTNKLKNPNKNKINRNLEMQIFLPESDIKGRFYTLSCREMLKRISQPVHKSIQYLLRDIFNNNNNEIFGEMIKPLKS